jgi:hypothetical protein
MTTYAISRREANDGSVSPDLGDDTAWRATGETFAGTAEELAAYLAELETRDGWPCKGIEIPPA